MAKCPKCKEEIADGANKCKHCNADLRNWFVRHKFLTGFLVLIVLIIIISAASGGKSDSNTQTVPNGNNQTTTANTETSKPKTESITITNSSAKSKGYGMWEVVGEAKNNDSIKHSATLKATFYSTDGSIMGTAVGAVNDIEAAGTKTFNLITTDSVTGYKEMKVQVDTLI